GIIKQVRHSAAQHTTRNPENQGFSVAGFSVTEFSVDPWREAQDPASQTPPNAQKGRGCLCAGSRGQSAAGTTNVREIVPVSNCLCWPGRRRRKMLLRR